MRCSLRMLGWVAIGVMAMPTLAAPPRQGKSAAAKIATVQEYQMLIQAGSAVGHIVSVAGNTIILRVDFQHQAPNQQARRNNSRPPTPPRYTGNPQQEMQQLQRYAQKLQQRQLQQLRQSTRVVTEYRDFELQTTENVRIRTLQLPAQYDDKGNLKKYTASERQQLKGNGSLPGYKADLGSLRPGQIVKVILTRKKAMNKNGPATAKTTPFVSTIIILLDPAETATTTVKGNSKKR